METEEFSGGGGGGVYNRFHEEQIAPPPLPPPKKCELTYRTIQYREKKKVKLQTILVEVRNDNKLQTMTHYQRSDLNL